MEIVKEMLSAGGTHRTHVMPNWYKLLLVPGLDIFSGPFLSADLYKVVNVPRILNKLIKIFRKIAVFLA